MDTVRTGAARERLWALDGLRFVAAMAVVLFHFTGRDGPAWGSSVREVFPLLSRVTLYGGFGPYLFFMISGFVVLMTAWGRPLPAFVASRAGRLFPAYWAAVLLTAAVVYLHQHLFPVWGELGPSGVALNLTMFQAAFGAAHLDGVYWTLWVELKFYLLLGLLLLVGITRERLLALCLAWPVVGMMAAQADARFLVALLEPNAAPFFCIGILLHLAHREGWSATVGLLFAANTAFALWVSITYYVPWSAAVAGAGVSARGISLLLLLCVAAVVAATMTRISRVQWRWLGTAGALTYPLYLVHEYPGWALISRLEPILPAHLVLVATVLVALCGAYLVHRWVERPLGPWLRQALERDLRPSSRALPTAEPAGEGSRVASR
ncbi:acyltransferase family protein [Blastococcus sp. VKM Ac-2987]|uniref:acyltransferase family protein n=1 Tax=Blastococcus sp. VKM Ac-2987 TaxID=3004141 RepID=UPI0022ABA412|nr:acyltransferase [Blastococcus sp. VKM Ac-2987]MCZ2859525.1 acyltransferase [Blastococcus sp. VKM Ac-2987]